MSERERRNLGEDERDGRELHDVCKGTPARSREKARSAWLISLLIHIVLFNKGFITDNQ